ncbi:MAG TPA: hypothetical protein DEF21_13315 [Thalassospira lucentensis]|uniref:Uncharacterized protein n=1 Tax=Thalassospira lucentensis TaxID=168935 RepID=A0A358HUL0_9PROT|nr:hypothetical protein [Thalassospira lucentensis]HCW66959.1 hypothetical protein [Thalassospira lucentensis]
MNVIQFCLTRSVQTVGMIAQERLAPSASNQPLWMDASSQTLRARLNFFVAASQHLKNHPRFLAVLFLTTKKFNCAEWMRFKEPAPI